MQGSNQPPLFPWQQQQQAPAAPLPATHPQQQQSQQQSQQQPAMFLPPHLRRTAQPHQPQPLQAEPPMSGGLMGLLAAHRNQEPQQQQQQAAALPPHLLNMSQQQQQGVVPPQAVPHQQPPTASGDSSSTAAAPDRTRNPPPGFKPPPPGFAPAAAAAQQQQQQQQQGGQAVQAADNRTAGAALLAALHAGGSPVKQPAAAPAAAPAGAAAGGGRAAASLPAHLQHLTAETAPPGAAAATSAAATQAPAGPVPDAPAQQQPPQQQQQPSRPRRSLQQWQELLQEEAVNSSAEAGGAPALFNLKESMRWIKGFAPEVPSLLDKHFHKYFTYIQDKHGPHVLACVVFFALGHHDVCKGATANLDLYSADFPAKVLNQRVSFYRILFSKQPASKATMLTSLVVHRPDIATWLSDESLRKLMSEGTPEAEARTLLAALLLLPEGWQSPQLLGPEARDPRGWLVRYVKTVLQDSALAEKMSAFLWRKADAARAAAAAAAAAAGAPQAAAGPSTQRPAAAPAPAAAAAGNAVQLAAVGSSGSSGRAAPVADRPAVSWGAAMAAAIDAAGSAAAAGGGAASVPAPAPSILQVVMLQELKQQQQQQQQGAATTNRSASGGSSGGTWAAAEAAQQQQQQQQQRRQQQQQGGQDSSKPMGADLAKMALVQFAKDRPDVVKYLPSELQKRILVMPPPVALAVLGTLNDLPAGWEAGHKKPAVHLAAAAARSESYAREQHDSSGSGWAAGGSGWGDGGGSSGGDGDGGWVTAGREAGKGGFGPTAAVGGGGRRSSNGDAEGSFGLESAAAAAAAAGGSSSVEALWKQLQSQRPDVWRALHDRHKALITPLTQEQQKKVLLLLLVVGSNTLVRASEPEAMLWALIQNHIKLLTQPMPPQVKAALQVLADGHPDVIAHMDDGIFSRICSMPQAKALDAVKALQEGDYGANWVGRCKNVSAWLNGIISRALRDT